MGRYACYSAAGWLSSVGNNTKPSKQTAQMRAKAAVVANGRRPKVTALTGVSNRPTALASEPHNRCCPPMLEPPLAEEPHPPPARPKSRRMMVYHRHKPVFIRPGTTDRLGITFDSRFESGNLLKASDMAS